MNKKTENVSIDDALAETKFGKFNYILIAISGMVMINVVLECCGISFVLPVIDCDMDLSYKQKGVLGAVSFLGMIGGAHLWGFLADTTGRRNVMRPTLIAGFVVTVFSSFSPNFWTLALLRFVNGFMIAGGSATIYAYLGEFHCHAFRNRAIMSSAFICASTGILSPIAALAIINQDLSFDLSIINLTYTPWRIYILLLGSLGLVCGLSLYFIPESPKYLLSIGKEEEALKVLRKMYTLNTGKSQDSFKIKSIVPDNEEIQNFKVKSKKTCSAIFKSMWDQTVPIFNSEHYRKTLLSCFIQFWTFYTAHGVYMWFPYILNKVMQYTQTNPDARLDICDIVYAVADANRNMYANGTEMSFENQKTCDKKLEFSTYMHNFSLEFLYIGLFLCMGYFTGKIGRIPTLFTILMICGTCGILSVIITIPIIAVYFHIIFLVAGLATVVVNTIMVDIFPTNLRAMAVSVSMMMGRIGSVSGTNLIGMLIENHCKMSIFVSSAPLILCAFLSLLLPAGMEALKTKKNKNTDCA